MRIKDDLPQFKTEHALLIVTGDQSGVIYHAYRGEIEKIATLKEEIGSESGGSFMSRVRHGIGSFKTLSSGGSSKERGEEKAQHVFLQKLLENIQGAARTYNASALYLFAPSYFKGHIESALEGPLLEILRSTFTGTHIKEHPFTILKMLKKVDEQALEEARMKSHLISEDARKLLEKGTSGSSSTHQHKRTEQVRQFIEKGKK